MILKFGSICAILISLFNYSHCELFTALTDLSQVFQVKRELGDLLSQYVVNEDKLLKSIIQFSDELKKFNLNTKNPNDLNEIEKNFSNPINSYLFTKKFVFDWKEKFDLLDEFVNNKFRNVLQQEISRFQKRLPVKDDIDGAIDALIRLQETYHLKTKDLIVGRIQNIQSNLKLNANDCFKIGVHAYKKENYPVASKWFKESLNLFKSRRVDENDSLTERTIMDYLAYCLGSSGLYRAALNYTNELLQSPNDDIRQRLLENEKFFHQKISQEQTPNFDEDPKFNVHPDGNVYAALCRGEILQNNTSNSRKLRCFNSVRDPYFFIGPLKTEVVSIKPRVLVFHDIIHDGEIERIKMLATPRLKRATVSNPSTGILEYANYRISKSSWLPNKLDKMIEKINQRIIIVTGLDIKTAEDLQVVNYGIAGYYTPHFDHEHRLPLDAIDSVLGNRIATLLFYLSDVEAGGATAFTEIKTTLWPRKGSAAFWFNLKSNGESDLMTRHAGCPVLVGSKWVMNKWFHERGQEFRRPCNLQNK